MHMDISYGTYDWHLCWISIPRRIFKFWSRFVYFCHIWSGCQIRFDAIAKVAPKKIVWPGFPSSSRLRRFGRWNKKTLSAIFETSYLKLFGNTCQRCTTWLNQLQGCFSGKRSHWLDNRSRFSLKSTRWNYLLSKSSQRQSSKTCW